MQKRTSLLAWACALVLGSSAYAAPFAMDGSLDLGDPGTDPALAGSTVYDSGAGTFTVTGGGSDWWDGGERGQFAYKAISGNYRLEANVSIVNPNADPNDWSTGTDFWAKFGVAFRNDIAVGGAEAKEVNAFMAALRPDRKAVSLQVRPSATSGMNNSDLGMGNVPQRVAIQRTATPFGWYVEGFASDGGAWTKVGSRVLGEMANNAYAGLAVTSHNNAALSTAIFSNVQESTDVTPQVASVPTAAKLTSDLNSLVQLGFRIHTIQAPWNYGAADELLLTGKLSGVNEGTRIDPVVNLHDTGGRGDFANDSSYPGIDPFEIPTADPAAGDDDNNFATEATGLIALTKGLHRIGANSDDGTIIWIGGVEIGRTAEWKGADTWDFIFNVEADGIYTFRAMNLEGGGGAAFELSDFDGSQRVLLNNGTIKVGQAIPEPATLSLLAVGVLGLASRRRKA